MGIKFANNASTNITNALTADATSVSVTPGTGNLFPSIVEGEDYFYATIAGNNGLEIVKVTKRVLDTMTLERAQDGTSALVFNQGDLFELRIVAAAFEDTFSNVDTTLEDTIDYLNSSIADLDTLVDNKMSSYLPLSGGDMTGDIYLKSCGIGHTSYVELSGDPGTNNGGFIDFHYNGEVTDNTSRIIEDGRGMLSITAPQGLRLNGNNVLTSSDSTLTGSLRFQNGFALENTDDTYKGVWLNRKGSTAIAAFDVDSPNSPGAVLLRAADNGQTRDLWVLPNGELKWDNHAVITSAGGTLTGPISVANQYALTTSTDSDALIMTAGIGLDAGGRVICHGKDHPSNPGKTSVVGVKDNKFIELTLDPEGLVSVDGSSPRFNTAFMPAGMVLAYAGQDLPQGCLLCDGSAVSRTTYAALFSAIGTIYGAGDGSTTFNLPNLEDRFIQGKWQSGHYLAAGLPDHTHLYESTQSYYYGTHGYTCLYTTNFRADGTAGTQYPNYARDRLGWASAVNGIYGGSGTVQPPALTMRYCIKY